MKYAKTAGAVVATAALSLTLMGCSSTPAPTSDEGSKDQSAIEQDDDSSASSSSSKSSTSSSSSSSSTSSKSSGASSYSSSYDDDDDDYSSSSSSTTERRQTYAQTDPDGWSYMEYNDGSAEITDGWGMVARDTDGDGDLDKISTDSGESWEDFE